MPTTVVVCDDHELIRRGLRSVLTGTEFLVVDEASTGIAALEKVTTHDPDTLLLDLGLPDLHGLDVLRLLAKCLPA